MTICNEKSALVYNYIHLIYTNLTHSFVIFTHISMIGVLQNSMTLLNRLRSVNIFLQKGWTAEAAESTSCFKDVDLSEKEWVDYDEKSRESVGVYEFESKFIPDKKQ